MNPGAPTSEAFSFALALGESGLQALASLALCILPAWWIVRRLRMDPLSRLSVAVLASLSGLFVLEATTYALRAPHWISQAVCGGSCLVSLIAIARSAREAGTREAGAREAHDRFPWPGVLAWCALLAAMLAIQSRIAAYGLPATYFDWHEHYQRTLFFLKQDPWETRFGFLTQEPGESGVELYSLPARGPLFNAVAAHLMSWFGHEGFWSFQIVATALNTAVILPLSLLLRDVARLRQPAALLLAALVLAALPYFAWHATFTWTKLLATGFILSSIHLHIRAVRENRPGLAGWSAFAATSATLAHYLAVVYAAMVLVHFILVARARGWRLQPLLAPFAGCALLAASWLGLLFAHFGVHDTLTANTTTGDYYFKTKVGDEGQVRYSIRTLGVNLFNTFVPGSLRESEWLERSPLTAPWAQVAHIDPTSAHMQGSREFNRFMLGNSEGVFRWSGIASLLIASILWMRGRSSRRGETDGESAWFWALFAALGIPLNILFLRWFLAGGCATVNLQPFVALALVFGASQLSRLPRWAHLAVLGACLFEWTYVTVSMTLFQSRRLPAAWLEGLETARSEEPTRILAAYLRNMIMKRRQGLEFLSDHLGEHERTTSILALAIAVALLAWLARAAFASPAGSTEPGEARADPRAS